MQFDILSKQVQDMIDKVAQRIHHAQNDIARLRSKQAGVNLSRVEFGALVEHAEAVNKEVQVLSATQSHLQEQVDEVQDLVAKRRAACEACARAEVIFDPHQAQKEVKDVLARRVLLAPLRIEFYISSLTQRCHLQEPELMSLQTRRDVLKVIMSQLLKRTDYG